jgi:integrase
MPGSVSSQTTRIPVRRATPAGPRVSEPVVTFGEYADRWLCAQQELTEAGLIRISSLHRYKTVLRAHLLPFFGARRLDEILREQVDGFRAAALNVGRLNPGTVNSVAQILRLILKAAFRDGLMDRDPVSGMRPFRVARRLVEPYTAAEVHRLIEATQPAQRVAIGLAAWAGLRQGEVFAIRPCDLDVAGRRVLVRRSLQRHHPGFTVDDRLGPPKTTAGYRDVPLQAVLAVLVERHLAEHWKRNKYDLVCPNDAGEPHLPIMFLNRVFAPAIRAANLRPMRFHDLRRCFVAQCVEAGIPVAQTAAWTGHTPRMVEHYYHVGHAQFASALALLDDRAQR